MEVQDTAEQWVSVEQLAQHLNVKAFTIPTVPPKRGEGGYKWLSFRRSEAKANERKDMPAHKVGRLWRFKTSEIDQWVRSGGAGEQQSVHAKSKQRKA